MHIKIKPQDIGNFKSLIQEDSYKTSREIIDSVEKRGAELINFDNDTVDINTASGDVMIKEKELEEHIIYDVNTKEIKKFKTTDGDMADKEVKKGFFGLGHEKAIYKTRNDTVTVDKETGVITYDWINLSGS